MSEFRPSMLVPVKETRRCIPALIILLLLVIVTAFSRPAFLTQRNLSNLFVQFAPLALVTLGQTLVLLVGGIDLSVGAMISLSTVLVVNCSGHGNLAPFQAVVVVLGTGLLVGGAHAAAVLRAHVPPLILTLGTMAILRGAAYWIQPIPGGSIPRALGSWFNWRMGLLSGSLVVVLIVYLVVVLLATRTTWGQHVYATGANTARAGLAGIRTGRVIASAYLASGLLAALAGLMVAARIYSADAIVGERFMMDSITAAVIGGASVLGGAGTPVGALVGAALLGTLNNVLNLFHVPAFYQYLLKGVLLLVTLLAMYGREALRRKDVHQ